MKEAEGAMTFLVIAPLLSVGGTLLTNRETREKRERRERRERREKRERVYQGIGASV